MKKLASLLICLCLLAVFAGCSSESALQPDQVFSVRSRTNGKVVSIGETRAEIEKITGTSRSDGGEYDDGVVRDFYWDVPGIGIDYLNDEAVAIILNDEDRWETVEKIRVGMSESAVKEMFADNELAVEGVSGGVLLGYDENLNPIKFTPEAPYYRMITFKEGKVDMIVLQYNFPE